MPYGKIANMAVDMFFDIPKAASEIGDVIERGEQPALSRLEAMRKQGARPWNIPSSVDKGFEIPIAITSACAVPELGAFKRLGLDAVVNAVWLAYFRATQENNAEAVSALESLILDWPMDFVHIRGDSQEEQEENMFKWSVNMSAKVERLSQYVGFENTNMMRMIATAADIVGSSQASKKANAQLVHKWLTDNVRWSLFNCPAVLTVERHLSNWATITKNVRVMALIEAALQRWGRNNLLDWPTKLQHIVNQSEEVSLCFVVEWLYCRMWRQNKADPYSASHLPLSHL